MVYVERTPGDLVLQTHHCLVSDLLAVCPELNSLSEGTRRKKRKQMMAIVVTLLDNLLVYTEKSVVVLTVSLAFLFSWLLDPEFFSATPVNHYVA